MSKNDTIHVPPKDETKKRGAKLVLNVETLRRLQAQEQIGAELPFLPTQPPLCT